MMLLFSCARWKAVTDVVNNGELPVSTTEGSAAESEVSQQRPTEIKREIESIHDIAYYPIDESRDIFNGLFDDIKDDNYDEWGDDFILTHVKKQDNLFSPDDEPYIPYEMYAVENNTIGLYFYDSSRVFINRCIRERLEAQKKRLTGFILLCVIIKENTNEYRLGNYIGKNISEVLNDFDNQYWRALYLSYVNGEIIFTFDLNDRDTKMRIMRVGFYTLDNIITKIVYKYQI